ncbi:uncharacterized protein Z519_11562 [Cladophialophora bantiana CBS 173.52]|uniref:Major facilitator superfamily (MFS) profile domain-containing protein n=1 Tax=Cladophialophora bantiana (strain ATCC 10958 / CBS 173.52 / CDC B-1940 / NIH 8579) TaxID=1442370 RepID=A0A0D2FMQ4_CLAB1|nr:uncharacterized protein Z519_11562 [Cladophialophora bantiana CBS 173.52]KIW87977.1 hypothetical protein Z519_11562 [Cladophialophora bantiana CBS 173.52]
MASSLAPVQWYFFSCIPGIFLVNKIGRSQLLLFGCVGMTVCLIIVGVTVHIGGTGPGAAAIVFIWLYLFSYAQGWNSIPWLYPVEIVPLDIRAQSAAISTSGNWIFNVMVVMVTPVCFASIGWKTYIMFAAFNAAVLPIVYFCSPETAQRTLEEMDIKSPKPTGVLNAVKVAKNEPLHFD